MQWSDVTFRASPRVLRQFAVLTLLILGGWGAWTLWRGSTQLGVAALTIAVVVGVVGLVRPQAIRWLFGAAMVVAFPIGWVVSQVLLLSLFVVVFTPIGFVFRLMKRDPLQLRTDALADSYWEPLPETVAPERYFQQF